MVPNSIIHTNSGWEGWVMGWLFHGASFEPGFNSVKFIFNGLHGKLMSWNTSLPMVFNPHNKRAKDKATLFLVGRLYELSIRHQAPVRQQIPQSRAKHKHRGRQPTEQARLRCQHQTLHHRFLFLPACPDDCGILWREHNPFDPEVQEMKDFLDEWREHMPRE